LFIYSASLANCSLLLRSHVLLTSMDSNVNKTIQGQGQLGLGQILQEWHSPECNAFFRRFTK